jgi:hypothetical protein
MLRQLRQRITLRCRTHSLTPEETAGYIAERLRVAGSDGAVIFTPQAIEAIQQYSRGIPRIINLLCEHGLISGFVDQKRPIQPETIIEVAREFDLHQIDPIAQPVTAEPSGENASLMEALQNLATLVDRLRRPN